MYFLLNAKGERYLMLRIILDRPDLKNSLPCFHKYTHTGWSSAQIFSTERIVARAVEEIKNVEDCSYFSGVKILNFVVRRRHCKNTRPPGKGTQEFHIAW